MGMEIKSWVQTFRKDTIDLLDARVRVVNPGVRCVAKRYHGSHIHTLFECDTCKGVFSSTPANALKPKKRGLCPLCRNNEDR